VVECDGGVSGGDVTDIGSDRAGVERIDEGEDGDSVGRMVFEDEFTELHH